LRGREDIENSIQWLPQAKALQAQWRMSAA